MPRIPRIYVDQPLLKKNKKKYYIVSPGSSWAGKVWPENNFSDVIRIIAKNYDLEPVLTGSIGENELCARIADKSGIECRNLSGRTSLIQLVELVRGAEFLIGNDSSAVHIAAAVNTTSFCIVGGGHYGRFFPYPFQLEANKPIVAVDELPCFQCNWKCTRLYDRTGSVPCIEGVKVEQVMNLIQSTKW